MPRNREGHVLASSCRMSTEDMEQVVPASTLVGWTRVDCLCAVLLPMAQFLTSSREWPDTPAAEMEKSRRALAVVRHLAFAKPMCLEKALNKLDDAKARDALRDWIDEIGPVDNTVVAHYEAKLLAA